MIFEPILDAVLVKVVFDVARKCDYVLLWLEFSKANAALILIC